MTRKFIFSFAAVAALAGTALMTVNADAMVVHNGRGGNVGDQTTHRISIGHDRDHGRRHFVRWHRHIWVHPVGYVTGVETAVVLGPCTCLTKNYTPEGMVVFQDLCTKEMASAPVDGSDQTAAVQGPASYAGKTYQDYLKANPQITPETKKD